MALFPYTMSGVSHSGENAWVAASVTLKNCIGVGDTQEEALHELESNESVWIEMAKKCGFLIPEITFIEIEQN